jgi:beta-glucosidase-like glycosyl hydrolase
MSLEIANNIRIKLSLAPLILNMKVSLPLTILALAHVGHATIPRACSTPEHSGYPFCDTKLSFEERVDDLVGRLTLTEKPYLLTARESPKGSIPRLGIPEYDWGANCIHGVQSRCGGENFSTCATSFPDPNFLGSTYNQTVWKGMGSVIGIELRALWLEGVGEDHQSNLPHLGLDCWSPNIGVVRDPRWGRNMETPSEDPLLNGMYGEMYTVGIQNGDDPRYLLGVVTLKHYDANSLEGKWDANGTYDPQHGNITRHSVNAAVSDYDLASTYLPAFRRSVEKGKAAGIMCSYNEVNGVPSCANKRLLQDLLRRTWGFDGYVTSDSGAVFDIYANHHFCNNMTCAVGKAISAGCDVESAMWPKNQPWSTGSPYINDSASAIDEGIMSINDLNEALKHALMIRFRLGLFDPIEDQPYWHVSPNVVRSKEHVDMAIDATMQGLVLLQNPGNVLPLDGSAGKTTAVIGPLATARNRLLGNYIGQICPGEDANIFDCVTSPLEGIKNITKGAVLYSAGLDTVTSMSTAGFKDAIAQAEQADQAILFVGLDGSVEAEGKDRDNIGLPGAQLELIQAIMEVNKNVVIVLINGGVLGIDELKGSRAAIIEGFYPGFYGAHAIATSLFGHSNRWGKLAVSIYEKAYTTRHNMLDFQMSPHGDQPGRTYRYIGDEGVLWPFGYGLSLTKFHLSASNFEPSSLVVLENTNVDFSHSFSIKMSNVGHLDGDNVVMGFFSPLDLEKSEPASALKYELFHFERHSLSVGDYAEVAFVVSVDTLMVYDTNGDGVSLPGQYRLSFTDQGVGSAESVVVDIQVKGEKKILKPFIKAKK